MVSRLVNALLRPLYDPKFQKVGFFCSICEDEPSIICDDEG